MGQPLAGRAAPACRREESGRSQPSGGERSGRARTGHRAAQVLQEIVVGRSGMEDEDVVGPEVALQDQDAPVRIRPAPGEQHVERLLAPGAGAQDEGAPQLGLEERRQQRRDRQPAGERRCGGVAVAGARGGAAAAQVGEQGRPEGGGVLAVERLGEGADGDAPRSPSSIRGTSVLSRSRRRVSAALPQALIEGLDVGGGVERAAQGAGALRHLVQGAEDRQVAEAAAGRQRDEEGEREAPQLAVVAGSPRGSRPAAAPARRRRGRRRAARWCGSWQVSSSSQWRLKPRSSHWRNPWASGAARPWRRKSL